MIGVALVIIVLLFGIITVKFIQYEKIIEDTERTWLITQYGPRDVNSMFYTLYGGKGQLIVVDGDRKSTRLNSSHMPKSRMPSSA